MSPVDGRLRQIKIGNWPAVPWAKAVARWDDHRRLRDEGIDPQHRTERAARKRDAVTVEPVARVFLAEHIAKECRTEKAKYDALRMFEGRVLGRGFAVQQQRLSLGFREAKHFRLKAFTPHDLRRSARTGLSRLGVRDEVAEAALGHVKDGIRGTHDLHRFEAEVGEALQKWRDHLDALQAPGVLPIRRSA